MLPGIFVFVFCLGTMRVTYGEGERNLTATILLQKLKVNLKVNCDALNEEGSLFKHWILPNLVVIGGNGTWHNSRNIVIIPDNFSLSISRIAKDQTGDYLCHAEGPNGRPLYSRSSIIVYLPPIWETYRLNFIMSLSASGVFVVIATIFCVVNSLRWRKTVPENAPGDDPLPVKSSGSGPEGHRKDSEPSADPKATTSGPMVLDEVTVHGITRVDVLPPLGKVTPDITVEHDTTM